MMSILRVANQISLEEEKRLTPQKIRSSSFKTRQLLEPLLAIGAVVFANNAGLFAKQMKDYLSHVRKSGIYKSRYIRVARIA